MKSNNAKKWWKKKKITIPVIFLVVLIVIGLSLESILLKVANDKAKTENPVFMGHISDLDLSLFKGGVTLEDVTGNLKSNGREFLTVSEVAVDLAWRELFKGNILFDVLVSDFHLKVNKELMNAIDKLPKPDEPKEKLPFNISQIVVKDSEISMLDFPGLNTQEHLKVNNIYGNVKNISQEENTPLATYDFNATFVGKSKIIAKGNFDMAADPVRWDMNGQLLKFELSSINKLLRKQLPVNYKEGTLTVYSEAKSEGGKIVGYVKPFLENAKYVGNNKEFVGAKHFFIEILGTLTNWIFENKDKDTVATRVPFIYENGAFSAETGEALSKAVEHGLFESDKVERGIEGKYTLNRANPEEAEAQEDDLEKAKEEKKDEDKKEKEKK